MTPFLRELSTRRNDERSIGNEILNAGENGLVMLDAWRKQAELFLGLVADAWAIVIAAIIPPAITSNEGAAQMRAIRISAVLVILIIGLWLNTTFAGDRKIDTWAFALLTLVYFTVLSWIVASIRWISNEERKRDDLVATSLSLVIGFVALSIFTVALVREFDVFYRLPVDNFVLRVGSTVAAVLLAALVTLIRSYLSPSNGVRMLNPALTFLVVLILMLGASLYIFNIA